MLILVISHVSFINSNHFLINMQCYEGKPLFEFDRTRLFRSGLAGFTLHGSLSHYYYQVCEVIIALFWFEVWTIRCSVGGFNYLLVFQALFPFQDWWVVPAKVAFDQTVWAAIWNSIYFVVLGLLRAESPTKIYSELKSTFLPMLTVRNYFNCFFMLLSDFICDCHFVRLYKHLFSFPIWKCVSFSWSIWYL